MKELGLPGTHGVHAQQHVILDLGLEQEDILEVSHVLAAQLILGIVSVSFDRNYSKFQINKHSNSEKTNFSFDFLSFTTLTGNFS